MVIPNTIKSIHIDHDWYAVFSYCKALTTITFEEGSELTEIGTGAFKGCSSLDNVTLPDSVTTIGTSAFEDCSGESEAGEITGISSMTFSESVTEIGNYAFKGCKNLGTATYKADPISIGEGAFANTKLSGFDLTKISTIGKYAFEGCKFTSVSFPEGTTEIVEGMFKNNSLLTEISYPDTVTKIKYEAFMGCTKLECINKSESEKINFRSVTSLDASFDGCTALKGTIDLSRMTELGARIFNSCGITEVIWPSDITTVGSYSFSGCRNLEKINLSGVTSIEGFAFLCCEKLDNVDLSNVTVIGIRAFHECKSLTEIDISKVGEMGSRVFVGCMGLKKISIGYFWESGKYSPFEGFTFYTDITRSEEVSWIDGKTFTGENMVMVQTQTLTLHYPDEEPTVEYYQCGTELAEPKDPEPKDRFLYWVRDGSEFDFNGATMPVGRNIDLYPGMKATVTYKDDDGTAYYTAEAVTYTSFSLPDEGGKIKRCGHSLVGWRVGDEEDVYGIKALYTVHSDTDVTAVWSADVDLVIFIADGNELAGDTCVRLVDGKAKLETWAEPPEVEGKYYSFLGWCYEDVEGNKIYYAYEMTIEASGTVRLTPYIVDYEVVYDNLTGIYYIYGGGEGDILYQSAEVGKKIMLPTSDDASLDGYVLAGWQLNGEDVEAPYVVPPLEEGEWEIELTAVWEPVKTATFKDADGSVVKVIDAFTGKTIALYDGEDMLEQESDLIGWKIGDSETVYGLGTSYCIDSDVVFTAARAGTADAVVYIAAGGQLIGDTYTPFEDGMAVLNTSVEKDGYMFLGWLITGSCGASVAYANGMHIEDSGIVRVKAYLVPDGTKVHKITYDFGIGTGSVTYQEALEGRPVALPTSRDAQSDEGSFVGWKLPSGESITGRYCMGAEDITLTAVWQVSQYTISFDSNGGSEVAPITQDYGSVVIKPEDPTKTGYTFSYWEKDGQQYTFGTMPAENIELRAVWQINQYTIAFDSDGGSEVAPITQDYGSVVIKPEDPTKTGYTFSYWEKDGQQYTFGTMPAENIELRAVWKSNASPSWWDDEDDSSPAVLPDASASSSSSGLSEKTIATVIAVAVGALLMSILAVVEFRRR